MAERVFSQAFVVVGAILEQNGRVLLVKEAWKSPDKGKWNQPAGWVDVGEDPLFAVRREVKEETGLEFEPTALLGVYSLVRKDVEKYGKGPPHAFKLIFRGKVTSGGGLSKKNEEISAVKWFSRAEIERMGLDELRDLDIKTEIADYFAGSGFPPDVIRHTISE